MTETDSKLLKKRPSGVSHSTHTVSAEGESTREIILRTSTILFADRGFDAVTIRDIAATAGFTQPTIYAHFGDKSSLYAEACKREFYGVLKELEGAAKTGRNARERLYNLVKKQFTVMAADRPVAKLLRRELLGGDAAVLETLTKETFKPHFDRLIALASEIAPDRDPLQAAVAIDAMMLGMLDLAPIHATLHARPSLHLDNQSKVALFILRTALPGILWSEPKASKSS